MANKQVMKRNDQTQDQLLVAADLKSKLQDTRALIGANDEKIGSLLFKIDVFERYVNLMSCSSILKRFHRAYLISLTPNFPGNKRQFRKTWTAFLKTAPPDLTPVSENLQNKMLCIEGLRSVDDLILQLTHLFDLIYEVNERFESLQSDAEIEFDLMFLSLSIEKLSECQKQIILIMREFVESDYV